ncbi:MAG TPA: DNA methyltransferase [Candidatus Thermoplasmatota archaeon]|nr:DNA methyltransferase [Candidatus Thermoplasmatota archaeon]
MATSVAVAPKRGTGPGGGQPAQARGVDPRNTLNELSGEQWLYFTKSVLQTSFPRELRHDLRKAHGANKPPALMRQLIEFFTKRGGEVLDPFAGVGGTLLGAAIASPPRKAVGIEVSPKWAAVYEAVAKDLSGKGLKSLNDQRMVVGDCLEVMKSFEDGGFDFIVTDPPYNVHFKITMSVGKQGKYKEWANRRTDFDMKSDDARDFANLGSYGAYLDAMEAAFRECFRVLKPGKYMALIVRNAYQGGRYTFTHADLAARGERAGFTTKGEVVWWQTGTRLRPYGYPHAYVPNIAHQHIVVLRRER